MSGNTAVRSAICFTTGRLSVLHHHRRGAVLLEVIVALAILSIAAVGAVTLARQSSHAVEQAIAADARVRAASAFMDVVSLWPRADLDRRLGDHPQGPWVLHIDHPASTLYRIALYDSTGRAPLLESALFRPVPVSVTP